MSLILSYSNCFATFKSPIIHWTCSLFTTVLWTKEVQWYVLWIAKSKWWCFLNKMTYNLSNLFNLKLVYLLVFFTCVNTWLVCKCRVGNVFNMALHFFFHFFFHWTQKVFWKSLKTPDFDILKKTLEINIAVPCYVSIISHMSLILCYGN